MKPPKPKTLTIPEGDWFVLVNGHMLAKWTGPDRLTFSVQYVQPLTAEEKAINEATVGA